jgi:hypothetical protein
MIRRGLRQDLQVAQGPDHSHLTDEQLAEEVRILRETKEKLDALHAGKPAPQVIEAAPGSVLSGTEIEVDAEGEGDQASA